MNMFPILSVFNHLVNCSLYFQLPQEFPPLSNFRLSSTMEIYNLKNIFDVYGHRRNTLLLLPLNYDISPLEKVKFRNVIYLDSTVEGVYMISHRYC